MNAVKKIMNSKYAVKKFEGVVICHGKNAKNFDGLFYIGLENIESQTGALLPSTRDEAAQAAFYYRQGQVLFPRLRPYLNKVHFAENDGVCSTEFYVLDSTTKEMSNEYLACFLRLPIVVAQTKCLMTGNTHPRFHYSDIADLPVPLPDTVVQKKIVRMFAQAFQNKKDKEKDAEAILGGIDDYLSKELRITWGKKEDTLGNRVFTRHRRDINSQRLDPRFYKSAYINLVNVLDKSGDVATIGELSSSFNSGSTPSAKGSAYTDKADRGVYFIRITDIENGKINYSGALKIKREIHKGLLARSQLAQGDILLSMAGTIGLSVVVLENTEANINQALAKITLKSGDFEDAQYVSEMLNSKIGRMQVEQYSRPALQANINLSEIAKIKIPMLPKQIRRKIMKEISQMRQHAEKLKEQARSELEDAKRYVEKIILGDGE